MSLPFPDFAAPSPTIDLTPQLLHWSELPAVEAATPILGEIVEGAEIAGAAAVLAEPALIIGAGVLAGVAANAILNQFKTVPAIPQQQMSRSGGRIGGGAFNWTTSYKLKDQPRVVSTQSDNSPITDFVTFYNDGTRVKIGNSRGGVFSELLFVDPKNIEEYPRVTNITPVDGNPGTPIRSQPIWVNPGVGVIPAPTTRNFPVGDGSTIPITWQPLPAPISQPGTQEGQPINIGINVYSPELGVLVNFNMTGLTIAYSTPRTTDTTIAPTLPKLPSTKYPQEPCPCPEFDATQILCRLKVLESGLLNDGYDYTSHTGASGNSGTQSISSDTPVSATLTVSSKPNNAKQEYGGGSAPDVLFAGWFAAIINGQPSTRVPIHYGSQTFILDSSAQGYCFSGYSAFEFTSSYVTKRKRNYVDNC